MEFARRERVLIAGDEGAVLTERGDAGGSVKLALRLSLCVLLRSSLGIDFSFSSVEAGDAERDVSRKDMETVRHTGGRTLPETLNDGHSGEEGCS